MRENVAMRRYCGVLAVFIPALVWGQQQHAARSVRASGEAVVYAKPDRATIYVTVSAETKSAQAAANQNTAKTQTVLAKLRSVVGGSGQVESVGYSIGPEYSSSGSGRLFDGYKASTEIAVTTEDLNLVAKVIDTAASAGAEDARVQFSSKNVTTARSNAIQEAARIARGYAEALAATQGVKLGRVLEIQEETPSAWSALSSANSIAAAGPGETMAVRVAVTATFAIE